MAIVVPPAGVSPLGDFTDPAVRSLPAPPTIRADKIDPSTQDFESTVTDLDPIDAAVIDALWRVRGSGGAVLNTGARFLDTGKVTDTVDEEIKSEARFALSSLIANSDITIQSMTTEVESDTVNLIVDYLNNRSATSRIRQAKRRFPEDVRKR